MPSTKDNRDQEHENPISKYIKERGAVFASIVIDCFFLAIWVTVIHITNNYLVPKQVNNFDGILLKIFLWVSGTATLITLLVYIFRDLYLLILDVKEEIQKYRTGK